MIKRLLSFAAIMATTSAAMASGTVIFDEDWSEFALDSSITSTGRWLEVSSPARLVVVADPNDPSKKVLTANFQGTDNLLTNARLSTAVALGQGLSMKFTVQRDAAANYVRFGFRDDTLNKFYHVDLYSSYIRVYDTGVVLSPWINFTPQNTPLNKFSTFTFQVLPSEDGGVILRLFDAENLLWQGNSSSISFADGVTPMLGVRSPVDAYISDITLTAMIPEPSHVALTGAAAILALVAVVRLRRRR